MTKPITSAIAAAAAFLIAPSPLAHAGTKATEPKPAATPAKETVIVEESRGSIFPSWPAGSVTLGAEFSEHNTGGYVDSITGLWASGDRNSFLFYNSRYDFLDNDQFVASTGLGFRQMILNGKAIIGANAYWDAIGSGHDNDFNQFGFGVEVLTKWVDARFNYFLPDNKRYEIGRSSQSQTSNSFGPAGITETTTTSYFKQYEAALEGFNAEIGFLVPGLDRYADVRLYAGYYYYDNPFGDAYDGFKARAEARVLQGVTFDVEYYEDEELNGGNWVGGVRVSLPFTFANIFRGRNPFEGAGETFKPYKRELKDRMGEMVIRSQRLQTVTSGNVLSDTKGSTRFTPVATERPSGSNAPVPSGGGGFPLE